MKKHMNDNQIRDYDKVLDAEFGAPGTPERIAAEEQARAFYSEHLSGKVSALKSHLPHNHPRVAPNGRQPFARMGKQDPGRIR